MIVATHLVAWRVWFARNEATHDKPLPSCDSSRYFLSGYWKLLHHCKDSSTEDIVKGKKLMVEDAALLAPRVVSKGHDKPWIKPPVD
jgi:hypothetical protein